MTKNSLNLIGYASGLGAGDTGCGDGPIYLYDHHLEKQLAAYDIQSTWLPLLYPNLNFNQDKYALITDIVARLAALTQNSVNHQQPFVTLAGDHACAIGTWSGAAAALRAQGDIGLIWVDAHLDSHTPETSISKNIHGMPVAVLLGYGHPALTQIGDRQAKIKPQNICIIGARSFEEGEQQLLQKLNVKIFYNEEVKQRGVDTVFAEAKSIVTKNTIAYGLSIDVDSIDPTQAPGTGCLVSEGLDAVLLCQALRGYCANDKRLLGCEITEFNPHCDKENKTADLVKELLVAIYQG